MHGFWMNELIDICTCMLAWMMSMNVPVRAGASKYDIECWFECECKVRVQVHLAATTWAVVGVT